MLKVRFMNFWPGFNAEESLFYACLNRIVKTRLILVRDFEEKVDIERESVFPVISNLRRFTDRLKLSKNVISQQEYDERYHLKFNRSPKTQAVKRIWFSGENLRAPYDIYDLTISFDPTDTHFKNLYFPYWKYRLDWGFGNALSEISPKPDQLIRSRLVSKRNYNACIFSSTREIGRSKLLQTVGQIVPIDLYGAGFGNPVSSKLKISQDYLFQVCPENSLTPGYITEKLQEAWFAGNLPIWHGSFMAGDEIFNRDAFIDCSGLNSLEIHEYLINLSQDKIKWMREQPLLLAEPTIDDLLLKLSNLI